MVPTPTEAAQQAVRRLGGIWYGRYGMANCPAHADRRPSLSITPGNYVVLFHCFAGCSHEAVIDALRRGGLHFSAFTETTDTSEMPRDLTPLVRSMWSRALPLASTPAQLYLDRRYIANSAVGRYDPSVVTYDGDQRIRLPALLLPIHHGHKLCALHRIFIDEDGHKTKRLAEPKRTLGDPKGGAIKIGAIANGILNLAEGFEDAQSAIALRALAGCWAVCGIERYQRMTIPDHVRCIAIYSQYGVAAENAIERARKHLAGEGRALEVHLPPPGGDWNDALINSAHKSAPSA